MKLQSNEVVGWVLPSLSSLFFGLAKLLCVEEAVAKEDMENPTRFSGGVR